MPTQPGTDRLSDRAKWTLLAVLALVLVLVLAAATELAFRLRQARTYGTAATIDKFYTIDERSGLRVPIANLTLGHVSTNSSGFRGPEIAVPKPKDTIRIAFLGASTTWCAEVSGNDKVWTHLVAEDLRQAIPGASIDYVNGGVPGYVVKSSLENLEYRVAPLDPDIIVIYHATNDMSAELRALAVSKGLAPQSRNEKPTWLSEHSLVWNLAEKNLRIWLAQKDVEGQVRRLEVDAASLGEGFRGDLEALVRTAQQHARVVAVATFSTHLRAGQDAEQQKRAAVSALYYMPFMTPEGLVSAYARYNQVIREVAAKTGAILIDGENDIPGDPENFADSVHFTDTGSRAMADRVARALLMHPESRAVLEP